MTRYEFTLQALRAHRQRWLVTGVAGFIGSHLLEALLSANQFVIGLDNFSTGRPENLEDVRLRVGSRAWSRFAFIEGDVCNLGTCVRAMSQVDFVLHEAALGSVPRSMADPLGSHASNVDGFVNVLMAAHAAGVKRVVFASSSSVYGDEANSPKQEDRIGRPLSPYATTKLVDEIYADTLRRTHGIDSVGLRYFNVFGPRQDPKGAYAAVIPCWTERLLSGEPCVLYGDGSTSRDFCYVANVVQANLLAALTRVDEGAPRIFNIACGRATTLSELFAAIRKRVGAIRPDALEVSPKSEGFRAGDVPHSLASIARAVTHLGYAPTHDLEDGLDETVASYARTSGHASTAARATQSLEVTP